MFKGGTALFFFYALDRFSEDLHFTQQGKIDIEKVKTTISSFFDLLNIPHEFKKESSRAGTTFKIKAQGPLYQGPLSESIVRIEISKRCDILLKPEIKEILSPYNDLRPFTVPVMSKEEIVAEKTRALLTRAKARDLYDLAFLLKKGASWDETLVNKKLTYYKKTFDTAEFKDAIVRLKTVWKSELHGLLPRIPEFEDIQKTVLTTITTKQ